MTNRKKVRAEINRKRHAGIKELGYLTIEERPTIYKAKKSRYDLLLEKKKMLKRMREERKKQKLHILKRKHIEKRAFVEAELAYMEPELEEETF